jgi:hypothetical protein
VIPLLLYVLATVDGAFCGYRSAAGTNARLDKRAYYRRAMWRGAIAAQLVVFAAGLLLVAALAASGAPAVSWRQLIAIGQRMLVVYVPYAALLAASFAVRAIPSVDVRSMTSTIVFGPLTFVRPLVVSGGLMWGVAAAPRPAWVAIGLLIALMMLSLEPTLHRAYRPAAAR